MGLIDSHAHLTFAELFQHIDQVLARCTAAGVERIITIATDLGDARRAVELARQHAQRIHVAAGFHPHEAAKVTHDDVRAMAELWDKAGVVALGEMGLDYHYDFADRGVQRSVFARQLASAARRDRPLIIHCREAFGDTVSMLLDHGFAKRRVVFHCFAGPSDEAARIAAHGWRISFTGIVTFRKSGWLQEIAADYPAQQLMVETDSPYLSPLPVRGMKPNEPANLVHIARFLADLRGVPFDRLVDETSRNTCRFFDLPISMSPPEKG